MAATPAVRVLEKAGVAHTLHPYDPEHPSDQGHGEAAVAALGADPRQVFKTLVARVDGALTVAVVPVSGTLDLKALAAAAGGRKAVMAEPADAERTTGYVLGGISPLGQRKALPTVVDDSALDFADRHGQRRASAACRSSCRRPTWSGSPGPAPHRSAADVRHDRARGTRAGQPLVRRPIPLPEPG